MTIEEQLKQEILSRYKSVRAFTTAVGIPYSTLDSVFKRGISNAGVSTMIKVFNALDLDIESIRGESLLPKRMTTKKEPPIVTDEERLNKDLISRLVQLTPDELEKVDAFVQGLLAAR